MIDPSKILATKITPIGARVLVKMPDGKKKWIWRDVTPHPEKKTTTSFEDYLSR